MIDPELFAQVLDNQHSRYYGKYRAKVTDNDDPKKIGRVKVELEAFGKLQAWAMPCVPYAGDKVGFYMMPPVDAGVWVEFEMGDLSKPIWVGCFWSDKQMPETGGDPAVKLIKTDKLTVMLDDGGDELTLETSSDAMVKMTGDVVTTAGQGKHAVTSSVVTTEAGGKGKLEVKVASVSVNTGTFEVT